MTNEQIINELQLLKNEVEELKYRLFKTIGGRSAEIRGTIVQPSNITATIAADSITSAMIASGAVKQSELAYEVAILAFASGDTSKTASVTAGSIVIGVYESTVTSTPATGELQLVISSTTLTGTRSAAPGGAAAITYTVILLKV